MRTKFSAFFGVFFDILRLADDKSHLQECCQTTYIGPGCKKVACTYSV